MKDKITWWLIISIFPLFPQCFLPVQGKIAPSDAHLNCLCDLLHCRGV